MNRSGNPTEVERTPVSSREDRAGPPAREDYINAGDIFYWMEDAQGCDVPLYALGIDLPLGCRFCI